MTTNGSIGKKLVGPSLSGGSESRVRINVLTKSQLVSNSGKMFVKFQWKNRVSRSSSSSLPGTERPTQTELGGLVLTNTGVQSYRNSTPSTFLILPQSATGSSSDRPLPSHPVSAGPQTFPGNVASIPKSPAASEVRFCPESINQLLPEQSTTENLRVQQLEELEPDKPDPTTSLECSAEPTEARSEEIQTREQEIIEVLSEEEGAPPAGLEVEPTRTREDPIVLSDEQGSSDSESLLDVYEVKPSSGEVETLMEPFLPGASGDKVAAVENETAPVEFEVTDASPVSSEDRVSVAPSEEPELGLKLSSSETSGTEDEDQPSAESWQQDYSQHYWQPTVSLLRLPLSLPGPGRPLPRYHFILGNQRDELYLQEVEDDSQVGSPS